MISNNHKFILAIESLEPNVAFRGEDGKITHWYSDSIPQPTQEAIDEKIIVIQAEHDSQEYARNRRAEYDQLNQFEMQLDDDRDGTTTWVDKINEIKARYPK